MDWYFTLILILLVATLGTTVATAITAQQSLARACHALGLTVAIWGAVATASGIFLTLGATSAPGLTSADCHRMSINGASEATYNALIAAAFAVPALLVARRVSRRAVDARGRSPTPGG